MLRANLGILLGIGLTVLSGCSDADSSRVATPTLPIESQVRLAGHVRLGSIQVPPGGGFVGVYEDAGGVPGRRVAQSAYLGSGRVEQLRIDTPGNDPVWVIVHRDMNRNTRLDFPGPDSVVKNPATGKVMSQILKINERPTSAKPKDKQP